MNIKTNLVPTSSPKRLGRAMNPTTLTIHSTANPNSTAANERAWLTNPTNTTKTSYHIVVDEKEAIICTPFNEMAYHAGDGANGPGNTTSIGLEICESGNRQKTLLHAAEVAAHILLQFGWGVGELRQHYDWSKKNCPRILRDAGLWKWFTEQVSLNLRKNSEEEMTYEKFREYIERYFAEERAKGGSEWSAADREWAANTGLFKGSDTGFAWKFFMTREEFATVLRRFQQKFFR